MTQNRFDVFFGFSQTNVDGFVPREKDMFRALFEQVKVADQEGYGTAWLAEAHFSIQAQKSLPNAVLTHFDREVGLNTDTLQLAHLLMDRTRSIRIGSAIRSILVNGGPIAHAESVRSFLALRDALGEGDRTLELGFAAGRFDFANAAYGVRPRTELERALWSRLKSRVFRQAVEIFLRFLRGDCFSSDELEPISLSLAEIGEMGVESYPQVRIEKGRLLFDSFWNFQKSALVPLEVSLKNLILTMGSHDPETQIFANRFLPTRIFNLSITPPEVIEATHERMRECFHPDGGSWRRSYLPRTVMTFVNDDPSLTLEGRRQAAEASCRKALVNYWLAMDGTISEKKVSEAAENALFGTSRDVHEKIRERFHPEDRLMLWFDFNNHDSNDVKRALREFMKQSQ